MVQKRKGQSWSSSIRPAVTQPASDQMLPLFHEPSDHAGLDALGRSFNPKRWPEETDAGFHKALLIRQMQECLDRAPLFLRGTQNFEETRAAVKQYTEYSMGTHPNTHRDRQSWNIILHKHFRGLARAAAEQAGPGQLVDAFRHDNKKAAEGRYPLWDKIDAIPRAIAKAETMHEIGKANDDLKNISSIDSFKQRREAYGRWLDHMQPYRKFIDKYADKPKSNEQSLIERMDSTAQRAEPMGMLLIILNLRTALTNAEEKLFPTRALSDHSLVEAYRDDRKGCNIRRRERFDFDIEDVRDSTTMDVVYNARWGALADRLSMTLLADGINVNKPSVSTKHSEGKVDALMEFCALKKDERRAAKSEGRQ